MPSSGSGSASGTIGSVLPTGTLIGLGLLSKSNVGGLIVGDTRELAWVETALANWTMTAATLSIRKPDQTYVSVPPTVYANPNTAALIQNLFAVWVPTVGGVHNFIRTFTTDKGETYDRQEAVFVAWSNVYDMIRSRTRQPLATLSDSEINREFSLVVTKLLVKLPCVGDYSGLSGKDRELFDAGAAILTALKIKGYKAPVAGSGFVTRVKMQTTEYDFIPKPGLAGRQNEYDTWYEEALSLLGTVSSIAAFYATRMGSFHRHALGGPTRQMKSLNQRISLFSIVSSLLTYDFIEGNSGVGIPE